MKIASVFTVRRALTRFGNIEYSGLAHNLHLLAQKLAQKIEEGVSDPDLYQFQFQLHWYIKETVLHDEEAECVPDSYPVLLVEVSIERADWLWTKVRCPYTIIVESHSNRLRDRFGGFVYTESVPDTILQTLKF